MQRIFVLLLEDVELLDLAGPVQVFDTANGFGASYELSFVGPKTPVRSIQGLELNISTHLPEVTPSDLILVPGLRKASAIRLDRDVARWLRKAGEIKAQMASVCSGAFVLGLVGMLDGRRCTTHWSLTERLARSFPRARVQEGALFVEDEGVTTSAGIASGIDMALSLLERDHGPLVTSRVAREMVVYMRRDGTQRQASVYLQYRTHLHPGVHRVQDWLTQHYTERVALNTLGKLAGLSGRHFARHFKSATGLTPFEYQQRLRLELASSLMQNPRLNLEEIAARCGFEDGRSLRRLWNGVYGHAPSVSRKNRITAQATS